MDNAARRLNAEMRAFFDGHAAGWDGSLCGEHRERLAGIVSGLGIARRQRVLDVGTGTGVLLPILGPVVGAAGLSVGIDISGKMLAEARKKCSGGHSALVQGDVLDLPLAAGAMDWVLCNSVFPHFSDVPQILREMHRVLTGAGRLAICHTQSRPAINALHRAAGGVVGDHTLPAAAALEQILTAARFRVVAYEDNADRFLVLAEKAR